MKHALALGLGMAAFSVVQASAADLPVKARPMAPVAMAYNWTGCHIGGNVGGKWVRTNGSVTVGPTALPTAPGTVNFADADSSTLIAGGQVGCDWQGPGSPFVFGIEGDLDWQRWSRLNTVGTVAPFPFITGDNFEWRSNWQGSVRGRVGYAWDRFMLYATGGVAFTNLTAGTNFIPTLAGGFTFPATVVTDSKTVWGPTVGGGLEYAFTNNFSAGIEGRYSWYGSQTYNAGLLAVAATGTPAAPVFTFAPAQQTVSLRTFEVMGKLNWKIF